MKKVFAFVATLVLIFTSVSPAFAQEITSETHVTEIIVPENNLMSNQGSYLSLQNETGELQVIPAQKSISVIGEDTIVNYSVELDESFNAIAASYEESDQKTDGAITVRTYISLTYRKLHGSSYDSYLLTNVSGGWTLLSDQVQVTNMRVNYACYDGPSTLETQNITRTPTNLTFSYVTGFTEYADDIDFARVSGQTSCTINRGTGSWTLSLNLSLI